MRLAYFRYALKTAADPHELLAEASRELQLTAPFHSLLEQFVPVAKTQTAVLRFPIDTL
jgi:hypothetical protein